MAKIITSGDKTYRIGAENKNYIEVDPITFEVAAVIVNTFLMTGFDVYKNKIKVIKQVREVLQATHRTDLATLFDCKNAVEALFEDRGYNKPVGFGTFDGKPVCELVGKENESERRFAVLYQERCPYAGTERALKYSDKVVPGFAYLDITKTNVLGWDRAEWVRQTYEIKTTG